MSVPGLLNKTCELSGTSVEKLEQIRRNINLVMREFSDRVLVQTPSNNHSLGLKFCFPFGKLHFLAVQKQSKGSQLYLLWEKAKYLNSQ